MTDLQTLADERDTLKRLLSDLLLSSFNGLTHYARSNACVELEHPPRSERHDGCPCGFRKDFA